MNPESGKRHLNGQAEQDHHEQHAQSFDGNGSENSRAEHCANDGPHIHATAERSII